MKIKHSVSWVIDILFEKLTPQIGEGVEFEKHLLQTVSPVLGFQGKPVFFLKIFLVVICSLMS